MKRNVVACLCSMAAVTLMAACQQIPDAAKTLDPSGLHLRGETLNWTTTEKDVPWDILETHPCQSGESIAGSGTSHWVIHTSFDNNGGLHYSATIVSKGTATGTPSGKAYNISEHFKQVDQVPGTFVNYVIYEAMRLKVDGPSTDFDYYKTTRLKIVVNGQGEPVISVDSESNSCT